MTAVMSPPGLTSQVSRHPTMPMTKRESLVINGSRLSLLSNGSAGNTSRRPSNAEFVNTHPDMVAGKKRSPAKAVKRTNSYKRALNRQSANDDLDAVHVPSTSAELGAGVKSGKDAVKPKRADDRKKYNTLPINISDVQTAEATIRSAEGRRQRGNSDAGVTDFQRNSSQRSGNYPSPDTDDDQCSIQPERKKKSTFKRVKERLKLTFQRDGTDKANKVRTMKDKLKAHAAPRRVHVRGKGLHSKPQQAFRTPPTDGAGIEVVEEPNNNSQRVLDNGKVNKDTSVMDKAKKRNLGIFASIRNSFRRKESPTKYRTSSDIQTPSSDSLHPISEISPPPSGGPSPHRVPSNGEQPQPITAVSSHNGETGESFADANDDDVTKFFELLINPPQFCSKPDRSKLRLDGLRKNRPSSFQNGSPTKRDHVTRSTFRGDLGYRGGLRDLSPDILEVDGDVDGKSFDDIDHPGDDRLATGASTDVDLADVVEDDQQHRIDEVASRLAAIGDRIATERESEGEQSEVEGIYPGRPRRLSSMEEDVMHALRRYADGRELEQQGLRIPVLPVIKDILAAQTYSSFKQVVTRELTNTHGWDQVAWYTYLIRTAVCLAGTGQQVGQVVSNRARRFFSSDLGPWIRNRPRGWESVHEETDIDTDLD